MKEALNAACLAAQCLEKEVAPVMVVEQVFGLVAQRCWGLN